MLILWLNFFPAANHKQVSTIANLYSEDLRLKHAHKLIEKKFGGMLFAFAEC